MRAIKKIPVFLLTMILCIGLVAMPALATSSSQDGLEVTLTTDKESYSQGEQIVATLTVTNTNDFVVNNVSLESVIPEGYTLAEGTDATKQIESLGTGETVALAVTYVPEDIGKQPGIGDDTGDTDTPSSGDNGGSTEQPGTGNDSGSGSNTDTGGNNSTSGNGTSGSGSSNSSTSPTTGDDSNIALWIALLVLACGGIVTLIALRKKSGKKLLSLFLCVAMVGTMTLGVSVSAEAAELQGKSISISEKITVGNTDLIINANVRYDIEEDEPADVGEISFREPSADHIVFDETTGDYFVDNEILITGQENATREEIEQIIGEINGVVVGCIEITNDYQVEISEVMTISELNEIVEQLNENEAIDEAMLHYLYEVEFDAVPNDSKWSSEEWSSDYPEGINWGVEAINAMGAWEHYDQMSYVKVGIIDSMFDTSHEDLVYTKVWNNPQSISSESLDYTYRSHGTHVSGTIAACYNNSKGIAGVAPKVTLYGYSILGSDSDSIVMDSNKTLMGFMEWKYALANLITSNCKVINVSMCNYSDLNWQRDVLGTFLNKLISNGYEFVIVQAAGNDSSDATVSGLFTGITIQAVQDRIIIVGAIGNNGSHKNGLFGWFGDRVFDGYFYAPFSNYGERVDIVAPGVDIYSTVPNNGYENVFGFLNSGHWDGTSMAAPHVTSIAAMCFAVNPALTGSQVKDIIVSSSTTTVTDNNSTDTVWRGKTYSAHTKLRTYPVANASASVELALDTHGEAVSPVNPSTGIVMGNVRGYNDNHQAIELSNVSVSAYRISDYDGNFSEYTSATQSDSNGNYELILEAGKYYINIYKDGYLPFAICDVTVTNDQITYLDNVFLIADSGAEVSNYIHGTVHNALTGSSIEGVTVQLRPGWDNKNGTLATVIETGTDAVTITDSSGQYSLEVLEGCYTAEFIKEGYITGYANVICTNMNDADQDVVLTPVLSDDEYRIVLTWSSTPRDLDSHISGPLSTGDRFHVYYSHMSASDNGETVAKLDLDDISSYGPETITLKKTQDGVYKYAVHDFTNRSSTSSTALSMSGAKVELYCGNSLIATYNVPINVTGTVWNVFEIEGDTIRTINTMENNSDPSTVCAVVTPSAAAVVMTINSDSPDKDEASGIQNTDTTTDTMLEEDASLPEDTSASGAEESISESYTQCPSDEPESGLSEINDDVVTSADIGTVDASTQEAGVVEN